MAAPVLGCHARTPDLDRMVDLSAQGLGEMTVGELVNVAVQAAGDAAERKRPRQLLEVQVLDFHGVVLQ